MAKVEQKQVVVNEIKEKLEKAASTAQETAKSTAVKKAEAENCNSLLSSCFSYSFVFYLITLTLSTPSTARILSSTSSDATLSRSNREYA